MSAALVPNPPSSLAPVSYVGRSHTHIRFNLTPQTPAVLPLSCVQEAITVPAQRITPMPNMHPCLSGLINRRSQVVWVVDLAQMLGFSSGFYSSQQFNLILVRTEATPLMFRVQEVSGILNISPDLIQPTPANFSSNIAPYVDGCVSLDSELLLVLNAEAIARSSLLQPS
ncbi:chemotaxis protein CheW [Leptolyngbya sp. O-77]|uniref:chemotaxis protein CheW n=1 Tax=Leptolyngbya sp. O-77 TaxID=1080068 RepID=UPI00074D3728|nr:chemotaxis protein CheW [Leptolyngbya sp. O-77]BAU43174.1 Chemotaxis protein CheW [Leptolyngbya sp. O-77]